jgi:hypothetical protein
LITEDQFQELAKLEYDWMMREREINNPDPALWRWSPEDLGMFREMLDVAVQLTGPGATFFEPGCGIGTKLKLAEAYGLSAHGWEIVPEYLEQCAELGVSAEPLDLRTSDPHYEEWDIVYTSRPFKDDQVNVAWEQKVQAAMRPGAVLIGAWIGNKPYAWENYYRRSFRGVWRKPNE